MRSSTWPEINSTLGGGTLVRGLAAGDDLPVGSTSANTQPAGKAPVRRRHATCVETLRRCGAVRPTQDRSGCRALRSSSLATPRGRGVRQHTRSACTSLTAARWFVRRNRAAELAAKIPPLAAPGHTVAPDKVAPRTARAESGDPYLSRAACPIRWLYAPPGPVMLVVRPRKEVRRVGRPRATAPEGIPLA